MFIYSNFSRRSRLSLCLCVCVCVWIHSDCVCESDKKEHSDQWKDELTTMRIVMSETLSVEKNVTKTLSE